MSQRVDGMEPRSARPSQGRWDVPSSWGVQWCCGEDGDDAGAVVLVPDWEESWHSPPCNRELENFKKRSDIIRLLWKFVTLDMKRKMEGSGEGSNGMNNKKVEESCTGPWHPGLFCWREMGKTLGLKRVLFELRVDSQVYLQLSILRYSSIF